MSFGFLDVYGSCLSVARPNKAQQQTQTSLGCFPWLSVRTAELGR